MEIRKCANCGKEFDLDDKASFKTIMHHQMHRYVCNNNKCMYEFYTQTKEPKTLNNSFNNEDDMQNQHWCMCVKLKGVARDGKSTCSICGGRDAYGLSTERPEDKKKTLTTH